jgi:hypothetical protein
MSQKKPTFREAIRAQYRNGRRSGWSRISDKQVDDLLKVIDKCRSTAPLSKEDSAVWVEECVFTRGPWKFEPRQRGDVMKIIDNPGVRSYRNEVREYWRRFDEDYSHDDTPIDKPGPPCYGDYECASCVVYGNCG